MEYLASLLEDGDTKSRQALEAGHFPDPLDYGWVPAKACVDARKTALDSVAVQTWRRGWLWWHQREVSGGARARMRARPGWHVVLLSHAGRTLR